jgi:hypothetical protein
VVFEVLGLLVPLKGSLLLNGLALKLERFLNLTERGLSIVKIELLFRDA